MTRLRRRPQVGRHDRRPIELRNSGYQCVTCIDLDVRTQSYQFDRVHEPILEDRFTDDRRAFRDTVDGHELRLHIGRKSSDMVPKATPLPSAAKAPESYCASAWQSIMQPVYSLTMTESNQTAEVRVKRTFPRVAAAAQRYVPFPDPVWHHGMGCTV